jgi:hypothetical protein
MNSPRELYQASMEEYRAVCNWWNAMSTEERRKAISRVEPLFWNYLTGIERWTIVRDAINGGLMAKDKTEAA